LLSAGMHTEPKYGRFSMVISSVVAVCSVAGAVLLSLMSNPARGKDATGLFFGAGALLLVAGMAGTYLVMRALRNLPVLHVMSVPAIGIRNCIRRPGRSLAVSAVLACGIFLVVAVAANRHNPLKHPASPSSGTGGFALYGETTLPILHALSSPEGRRQFGLSDEQLAGLSFVYLRARAGDDASCLNLNRVQQPRILAVDPDEFARRHSFTFAAHTGAVDPAHPWDALKTPVDADTIPAVGDQSMILWGLGKSLGDTIEYVDEQGRTFKLKLVGGLANSIFQGSLIIDKRLFEQRFPSVSGANVLLVDAPPEQTDAVCDMLGKALEDSGLDCMPANQRLAEFVQVENTYLTIFLALGGLGLLLGSAGLGIIVVRTIAERRGEFALLRAIGFDRHTLRRMVIWEHLFLLGVGLVCGTIAALLAVLPAVASPAGELPWLSLILLILLLLASGFAWIYLAATIAMRAPLIPALRNE